MVPIFFYLQFLPLDKITNKKFETFASQIVSKTKNFLLNIFFPCSIFIQEKLYVKKKHLNVSFQIPTVYTKEFPPNQLVRNVSSVNAGCNVGSCSQSVKVVRHWNESSLSDGANSDVKRTSSCDRFVNGVKPR